LREVSQAGTKDMESVIRKIWVNFYRLRLSNKRKKERNLRGGGGGEPVKMTAKKSGHLPI
jgi:hypothetical protein